MGILVGETGGDAFENGSEGTAVGVVAQERGEGAVGFGEDSVRGLDGEDGGEVGEEEGMVFDLCVGNVRFCAIKSDELGTVARCSVIRDEEGRDLRFTTGLYLHTFKIASRSCGRKFETPMDEVSSPLSFMSSRTFQLYKHSSVYFCSNSTEHAV